MFFETLKREVYEFHTPKYIELSNEEYIDGGNKIVKDVFATSNNGSKKVYYVEINSNGEKVFISEEVYYKLEKAVQESIEDILIENHHLYDNEDYKLYNIAQRKMYDFPASHEDERDYYYYECEESANYIYSCDIIKFTYDWLEDNNIKKLKKEIEELKQQLENTENEMNRYKQLYQEERDYDGKYTSTMYTTIYGDESERFIYYIEVDDLKYIEMSDKISRKKYKNNDKQHYVFLLNYGNQIFNDEYIKKMIKKKQIPTYYGIPFRNLQDYYEIIKFLKSEKYNEIIKENKIEELTEHPLFELYHWEGRVYPIIKLPNKNILLCDNVLKNFNKDMDICFCFKNAFFETYRELRYLIKKECYKDKKILNQCL